jgi:glyoxylase-like metal-dependent hydrolase (beta-lactamase superfamily II)
MAKLRIRGVPLGTYQTNAYLLWIDSPDRPCWVIDPGEGAAEVLLPIIRAECLNVQAILCTHAHHDHIAGLESLRRALGEPPLHGHAAEQDWYGDPSLNLSAYLDGPPSSARAPDHALAEGDQLALGPTSWRVMHVPGHSPGSVALVCDAANVAIVGDTMFAGSIGRSDLPGANPAVLAASLSRMLQELPDAMAVHPGHGPSTTIGAERRSNPFLQRGMHWARA